MKRKLALMPVLLLCLTGCVTGATNPFYTPETTMPLPELQGDWFGTDKDGRADERTPVEISGRQLIIRNDDGTLETGEIVFFYVEEQLFADVQMEIKGEETRPHLLYKVTPAADTLTFIPLDFVWLQAEIGAGNIKLPFVRDEGERTTLFTASSRQWIEFIKVHKDNHYAFPVQERFTLERSQ